MLFRIKIKATLILYSGGPKRLNLVLACKKNNSQNLKYFFY